MNLTGKESKPHLNQLSTSNIFIPLPGFIIKALSNLFTKVSKLLPNRFYLDTWILYEIDLSNFEIPNSEANLTRIDNTIINSLKSHPDALRDQVVSGFSFWEHGINNAYIWIDNTNPLCMQWLLSNPDLKKLRSYSEWSGLYPPLPDATGQVENLFSFRHSLRRKKSAATEFEYALYKHARQIGLLRLKTHIHFKNVAAIKWAQRTGFSSYGNIYRCSITLPFFKTFNVNLHSTDVERNHNYD